MENATPSKSERLVRTVLKAADIELNGNRPWDIRVHDKKTFDRIVSQGSLGLGEAYMDGWWDCDQLDEFFNRIVRTEAYKKMPMNFETLRTYLAAVFFNLQNKMRSKRVGKEHYDLGNDFYQAMLDPYMQYSCAYFKDTDDLATAERHKMELICKKLQLKKGEKVLDIGCGWGGLAKYMAEHYEVEVTGITISQEQAKLAQDFCKGYPVKVLAMDYRDMSETFDKIVSVGMFEHVGYKNYRVYMETAARCLKDDGIFLLHTIGQAESIKTSDPWFDKYIFPGGMLPSMQQITRAAERLFVIEDWHNFGAYYEKTLLGWYANYRAAWPRFRQRYGDRFGRMWDYYLLSCAGGFRARGMQLWQIVLTKKGMIGGYSSVR